MKDFCNKQVSMGVVIAVLIGGIVIGGVVGKCMSKHKYGYKGGYGEKHKMMMEKRGGMKAEMGEMVEDASETIAQ